MMRCQCFFCRCFAVVAAIERARVCALSLVLASQGVGAPEPSACEAPLAKGGPNGGHRPPLPCALPMEGFLYEFGPETRR